MNIDLNRRIFILVLIPSLLMGTSFVGWFSTQQIKELYKDLSLQIEISAQRIAATMEYGLILKNSELIHQLAKEALNEDNVRSITVLDLQGKQISQVGPDPIKALPSTLPMKSDLTKEKDYYKIIFPVVGIHAQLFDPSLDVEHSNVGWVVIELTTSRIQVRQYQIMLVNLLILLFAIALSVILAFAVTRSITSPLTHILNIVGKLKNGNSSARVGNLQSKEMTELGDGINVLAESLERAYTDMQKNIDQATNDLRETLETLEIQNIELDMARKEAIDASRIKSEFLSNMSHEIRTPLNGIIGFIKLLLKSNLTRKQEDYSKTVLSSSESLLSIINDVLDFAKIEAGKLALDNMSVDLKHAVEDVLVMLAPSAHARQIDLVPLYFNDVPEFISGDPLRIKQVITNLVNNAIKFTEKGQVIVRVSLETDYGNAVSIKVSVSDTGIGLTKDQQKALFQSFQQANTSTAREYGGTGLGLIISKKIVEQMGGDIGIESEYGKGSTFWFTFKAELSTEHETRPIPEALNGKTAIIYDTNPAMQSSLRHELERWNIVVVESTSIDDLIKSVKMIPADIAIIGIGHTNQIKGKLHRQLAELVKNKGIFTLVLSSSHEDNINMKLIEQNASAYLSKPFHSSKLSQVLLDTKISDYEPTLSSECRILAVDDNPANLKLIKTLLEDLGVDTTTANSGEMAIKILEDHMFDLIFMDIQMPHMDGMETTLKIRSNINHPSARIPVVAVTAHAMANEKDKLLRNGMDDYLTKPIDDHMLIQTISRWTGNQMVQSEATTLTETQSEENLFSVEPVISIDISLKRANGKLDLAIDMFNSLIEQLKTDRIDIAELLQAKNYNQLLERVHKIHGATHYCGVPALKASAENFEILLKQEKTARYTRAFEEFIKAINDVLNWAAENNIQQAFETNNGSELPSPAANMYYI